MSKKRCDWCKGKFGLTRQRYNAYSFCRKRCKKEWLKQRARDWRYWRWPYWLRQRPP